jgi:hypothetical protein
MSVGPAIRFASVMVVAWVASVTPALIAQSQVVENTPVVSDNPILRASLDRLAARSSAWRNAIESVSRTGRRAFVVTPDRVRMTDEEGGEPKPFDADVLAEVQPIADPSQRVEAVVVVINLALLEEMQGRSATVFDFESDLDRILAHEVYGHAVPYLLAGHLSGRCADPTAGQRATDSCAIQRENEVRIQLGLGRRTEYGLHGLAMVRRSRH